MRLPLRLNIIIFFAFIALPLSALPLHDDPVAAREHGTRDIMQTFGTLEERGFLHFLKNIAAKFHHHQ